MGQIQSSIGLVTGTDIFGTVDQLIAISGQPRDRLVDRTTTLQSEQQAITSLTATVIGVQLAVQPLSQAGTFQARTVQSSDTDAITATAGSNATPGEFAVRTLQAASTQNVLSGLRFDSQTEPLGFSGSLQIGSDGFLDQSLSLSELNNGRGVEGGTIRITDRSGQSADIDLTSVQTVDEVLQTINDADIDVRATTVDGQIQLIDQTGSTASNLIVEQLGLDETAADLGLFGIDVAADSVLGNDLTFQVTASTDLDQLRQGQGIRFAEGTDLSITLSDGTTFDVDFGDFGGAESPNIQDVIDQLNTLDPNLSVAFTSQGIEVTDLSGGTGLLTISDAAGSTTATDLGLAGSTSETTLIASFDQPTLRGTSLEVLSGGQGISGLTTLDITTADGTTTSVDLSGATNTAEILDALNGSGAEVIATLNDSQTGLRLRDVSGGNGDFVISSTDDTASQLGLLASTQSDEIVGSSLTPQIVDRDTLLSSLNQGDGITSGSFTIEDSAGTISAINLVIDGIESFGDLIDAINGLSVDVTASINEAGDGISIVDNAGGTGTLTISDVGISTAAADLGIEGTATEQTIGGLPVSALVGTQGDRIEISADDSLASIVDRINALEGLATASIQTNSDGSFQLQIRSNLGGESGRLTVATSDFDLAFDTTAPAQDAIIAVSIDGGEEQILTSSDGVFDLAATTGTATTINSETLLTDFASSATSGSFTLTDSAGQISAINVTTQGITTVGGLVDAINALGIGVSASINQDGTGIDVIDTAGGDAALTIADVGNGIAAASLGIAGEATTQTIGGLEVSALSGNGQAVGSDDATGLVLTLTGLSSETITVSVEEDDSAIVSAANSFVNQFNTLIDQLDELTFFNSDTNEVGLLFGSSEASRIRNGFGSLLSGALPGAGNLQALGQVGIGFNGEGQLELDTDQLTNAISNSRSDVEAFFTTETTGVAARVNSLTETLAGAGSSVLITRTETLSTIIQNNNDQIARFNEQLEIEREQLLLEFFRTEEAISQLQGSASAINSIQPLTIPT